MEPRKERALPVYAQFAEILPSGKGRVYDGKRWIDVDPREIRRAVQRAILDEASPFADYPDQRPTSEILADIESLGRRPGSAV